MSPARDDGQAAERVVIRDKRKIDPTGGKAKEAQAAESDKTEAATTEATKESTETTPKKERKPSHAAPEPEAAESTEDESTVEKEPVEAGTGPLGAELEALRSDLEERTRDLQRVTAEYANYRKRVDRDRGVQAEQATGLVITALLPVLDDLDRAREHGDLVGPFAAVAEQLIAALGKFGLTAFGEKGDPFDPTRHEAVAHRTSSEVTEPTCVEVMRRGYLLGDRLLRAALVAVADPE
ncbi:nucleotide exchange factor GrpE [Phytohabitans kaempferiae]|uniref:Protein GrpE n=1 Tax=Phytohabitans kaempferiae TaxID=1620943 RepID=A0ABV6M785_9ACTN